MMTVTFVPVEVTTFLQCRRGTKTFRKVRIDPKISQADYHALPACTLEIVDARNHVYSRADITENRGGVVLNYEGPPTSKPGKRVKTKDDDDVLEVGGERSPDGKAVQRPVHVPLPSVDSGDARLDGKEECGSESGPDGLHGSDDEPDVLDNRYATGVGAVSPADEDPGRDRLLSDAIRSRFGDESPSE